MDIGACYKIGYVLKPHGLKGEVTISLDSEIPDNLDTVFLGKEDRLVPYFIDSVSIRGSKAFVKFEDVDTPEAAANISKQSVYLPKTSRAKSGRGEFYDDEVIDYHVTDNNAGPLGNVKEVMTAGSNRLLVINYHGREVLVPINSPFITSVNKSKKTISVNLPDGFLDI